MNVDPLLAIQAGLARSGSSLSFAGDGSFASKLTLGQIIKGRVLLSYEGGRHLVDFDGQQKVVDSAVPLRPDEVLYGRVTGLGERVELQRVRVPVASSVALEPTDGESPVAVSGKSGELVTALFGRFHARLSPAEFSLLQRAVERAPVPEAMAQAGLILSKLGLPLTVTALRSLAVVLAASRGTPMFSLPTQAIHLETGPMVAQAVGAPPDAAPPAPADLPAPATPGAAAMPEAAIPAGAAAFAALLGQLLHAGPAAGAAGPPGLPDPVPAADRLRSGYRRPAAREQGDQARDSDLARQILNVQPGGAVAHRVGTLPLFVDGRLVELDIALFDQTGDSPPGQAPGLAHRRVVFAMHTQTLGRVEVQASSAGAHMRIRISSDAKAGVQYLADHAAALSDSLAQLGWQIDELAYQSVPPGAPGAVAHSVLEHLVAPGSVSELA